MPKKTLVSLIKISIGDFDVTLKHLYSNPLIFSGQQKIYFVILVKSLKPVLNFLLNLLSLFRNLVTWSYQSYQLCVMLTRTNVLEKAVRGLHSVMFTPYLSGFVTLVLVSSPVRFAQSIHRGMSLEVNLKQQLVSDYKPIYSSIGYAPTFNAGQSLQMNFQLVNNKSLQLRVVVKIVYRYVQATCLP